MDLLWLAGMHALNSILEVKTLYHTEKQGFGYLGFQKKFQTHPPKPTEAEPSFRKSAYSLKYYACFSPLTSGLESFGNKSTPSDQLWIETYCPNFS